MHAPYVPTEEHPPCHDSTVCDGSCAAKLDARDQFISMLGVELRNSVSPLVLIADQFAQLRDEAEQSLALRIDLLNRNLRKLTSTIDRVTELSALRHGNLELSYELVDLREVIDDVVRDLADDASRAGARLHVVHTTPVQGWWDRARVKQIVSNLASNAIRYGDGAEIELGAELCGPAAELVVSDDGPGIPSERHRVLFDRFDHAPPSTAGGFGCGLSVVKLLSVAMGGSVRLDPGTSGARFCVTLPRG